MKKSESARWHQHGAQYRQANELRETGLLERILELEGDLIASAARESASEAREQEQRFRISQLETQARRVKRREANLEAHCKALDTADKVQYDRIRDLEEWIETASRSHQQESSEMDKQLSEAANRIHCLLEIQDGKQAKLKELDRDFEILKDQHQKIKRSNESQALELSEFHRDARDRRTKPMSQANKNKHHEQELSDIGKACRDKIQRLEQSHKKECDDINTKHTNTIQQFFDSHDRDIAEMKKSNAELRKANTNLKQVNKDLDASVMESKMNLGWQVLERDMDIEDLDHKCERLEAIKTKALTQERRKVDKQMERQARTARTAARLAVVYHRLQTQHNDLVAIHAHCRPSLQPSPNTDQQVNQPTDAQNEMDVDIHQRATTEHEDETMNDAQVQGEPSESMNVDDPDQMLLDRLRTENEELRENLRKKADSVMESAPTAEVQEHLRREVRNDFLQEQGSLRSLSQSQDSEIQRLKQALASANTSQTNRTLLDKQLKEASELDYKLGMRERNLQAREEASARGRLSSARIQQTVAKPTQDTANGVNSDEVVNNLNRDLKRAKIDYKKLKKALDDEKDAYNRLNGLLYKHNPQFSEEHRSTRRDLDESRATIERLGERIQELEAELVTTTSRQETNRAPTVPSQESPSTNQSASPSSIPSGPTMNPSKKRDRNEMDDENDGANGVEKKLRTHEPPSSMLDRSDEVSAEEPVLAIPASPPAVVTPSALVSEHVDPGLQTIQDKRKTLGRLEREYELRQARDGKKRV